MSRFCKDNGLTLVLMLLFAGTIVGQLIAGWHFENEELARHGEPLLSLLAYSRDPQFLSMVFENWESEFLQMSAYVVLTGFLVQRGSAESKDPDAPPRDDDLAAKAAAPGAPRALRAGPAVRWLYAHSLGLAMATLFVVTFVLHWIYSAQAAGAEARDHGVAAPGLLAYLGAPQFWFESFQNWQSEFLSTAVLVVLTIFLRQKESPESKPVAAPHRQTGA